MDRVSGITHLLYPQTFLNPRHTKQAPPGNKGKIRAVQLVYPLSAAAAYYIYSEVVAMLLRFLPAVGDGGFPAVARKAPSYW
mgnify:FL=1